VSRRHIYVDIDDVLSQTVESLIDLLERLHDRRIEVAECLHFDLGRSFSLDEASLLDFMDHAHSDEVIVSIEPVAGAAETLDHWSASGDRVTLVTGRPPRTREASLLWLETHGLEHDALHHLDKWNRPSWNEQDLPALRFEEIGDFGFEFAVEDSLETAVRLIEEFEIPVALMDRPWNRELGSLSHRTRDLLVRCRGWDEVATRFGGVDDSREGPHGTRSGTAVSEGSTLGRADEHGEG
jgi:uncharacterized HAD superfamily protein